MSAYPRLDKNGQLVILLSMDVMDAIEHTSGEPDTITFSRADTEAIAALLLAGTAPGVLPAAGVVVNQSNSWWKPKWWK